MALFDDDDRPEETTTEKLLREFDVAAGDRALVVALMDDEIVYEDGGFLERPVLVSSLPHEELSTLYGMSEDDLVRIFALVARMKGRGFAVEQPALESNVGPLGEVGRLLMERVKTASSAALRVELRWMLREPGRIFEAEDEELRLAATRSDPTAPKIGTDMWRASMNRYPREPSARVRRGIVAMWTLYRRIDVPSDEAMMFLADADPEVRRAVAAHVLQAKVTPPEDEAALKTLAREALA